MLVDRLSFNELLECLFPNVDWERVDDEPVQIRLLLDESEEFSQSFLIDTTSRRVQVKVLMDTDLEGSGDEETW